MHQLPNFFQQQVYSTQTVFLGHIHTWRLRSPTTLSESQLINYGSCTKDGVRLIQTTVIDNILTWLIFIINNHNQRLLAMEELIHMNHFRVILQKQKKKKMHEYMTREKAHVYDKYISMQNVQDQTILPKLIEEF